MHRLPKLFMLPQDLPQNGPQGIDRASQCPRHPVHVNIWNLDVQSTMRDIQHMKLFAIDEQ
jgi:hypothetical protein